MQVWLNTEGSIQQLWHLTGMATSLLRLTFPDSVIFCLLEDGLYWRMAMMWMLSVFSQLYSVALRPCQRDNI